MCIDARTAMTWWTPDPIALGVTGVSSALYFMGARRLWKSAGVGHGVRRWEVACFIGAQLSILIALCSPIDRLSDLLFSAHMTQHEILILIAPPLFVLARPLVPIATLFPSAAKRVVLPMWTRLASPLVVLVVHGAVIWIWHLPVLFEAALRNEALHTVQHAMFFITASLFWWGILRGRYGRAGYGLAALFVFATATHTSILGVLFTAVDQTMYPLYRLRGTAYDVDVDPVDDQRLAGLIMWIPAGTFLGLASLGLFAAWLGEARRRALRLDRKHLNLEEHVDLTQSLGSTSSRKGHEADSLSP